MRQLLSLSHTDGNKFSAGGNIVPVHGKRCQRLQAFLIELHVNISFVFTLENVRADGDSITVVMWLHRDLADLQAERINILTDEILLFLPVIAVHIGVYKHDKEEMQFSYQIIHKRLV